MMHMPHVQPVLERLAHPVKPRTLLEEEMVREISQQRPCHGHLFPDNIAEKCMRS
ncbi:hypothetical protein GCM10007207_07100 [Asaia siamensis]|uniref:Uncharacterized protein n=1 Tax=Asaia siamensis TaxID=110479 RepID=A0ABQ1LGP9_9PROT|nr:hypothetical protein GCM10007207_07100 [Asaia siamensis]